MTRIVIGLALLGILVGPAEAPAETPGLSPGDLSRLSRGEILYREQLPTAEDAPAGNGGTAVAVLKADPEEVWRILMDFDHYAGLFPRLKGSEVVHRNGERALVRFHVAVGFFNFRFFVAHMVSQEGRELRWRLDRSRENDLFRDTWGYWRLDPLPDGRVLVTYAMGSQTVLPAFMTRGSEQESVVKTVAALKARVEQSRGVRHAESRPGVPGEV